MLETKFNTSKYSRGPFLEKSFEEAYNFVMRRTFRSKCSQHKFYA